MSIALRLRVLIWIGGPVAVLAGLAATWLFTNIPGLQVYGSKAVVAVVAKAIAALVVFTVSALLIYLGHFKLVQHLLKVLEPYLKPLLTTNDQVRLALVGIPVDPRLPPRTRAAMQSGQGPPGGASSAEGAAGAPS